MYPGAIKPFVICTLGAAVIAGCASPPSSTVAFDQRNAYRGEIAEVENNVATVPSTAATSSGSSGATTAGGGSEIITVRYTDGSQGRYLVKEQAGPLKAGQPVAVIKSGDNDFTIFSR